MVRSRRAPPTAPADADAGALASWQDAQGVRWIAVPAPRGIVAMKVVEQDGKLTFAPGWTSREIATPLPPLVINGVLFADVERQPRCAGGALRDRRADRERSLEQRTVDHVHRCAAGCPAARATSTCRARTARSTPSDSRSRSSSRPSGRARDSCPRARPQTGHRRGCPQSCLGRRALGGSIPQRLPVAFWRRRVQNNEPGRTCPTAHSPLLPAALALP